MFVSWTGPSNPKGTNVLHLFHVKLDKIFYQGMYMGDISYKAVALFV